MCLYSKSKTYKIAEKDITCYKVMLIETSSWVLNSPYRNMCYFLDVKYQEDYFNTDKASVDGETWILFRGFHSYINLSDALSYARNFNSCVTAQNFVVVKCIIPKGARYYEGSSYEVFSDDKEYCADQIKAVAWAAPISPGGHTRWHKRMDKDYVPLRSFVNKALKRVRTYYENKGE